jgi:hypothetical protein
MKGRKYLFIKSSIKNKPEKKVDKSIQNNQNNLVNSLLNNPEFDHKLKLMISQMHHQMPLHQPMMGQPMMGQPSLPPVGPYWNNPPSIQPVPNNPWAQPLPCTPAPVMPVLPTTVQPNVSEPISVTEKLEVSILPLHIPLSGEKPTTLNESAYLKHVVKFYKSTKDEALTIMQFHILVHKLMPVHIRPNWKFKETFKFPEFLVALTFYPEYLDNINHPKLQKHVLNFIKRHKKRINTCYSIYLTGQDYTSINAILKERMLNLLKEYAHNYFNKKLIATPTTKEPSSKKIKYQSTIDTLTLNSLTNFFFELLHSSILFAAMLAREMPEKIVDITTNTIVDISTLDKNYKPIFDHIIDKKMKDSLLENTTKISSEKQDITNISHNEEKLAVQVKLTDDKR